MLYCYGRNGDYDRALDLFKAVAEQQHRTNIPITRKMYHSLMEAYATFIEKQIIHEQNYNPYYGSVRRSDPIYPVMIDHQLRRLSLDPLLAIYSQLLASKVDPTIETITIVLKAAGRLRRSEVIERMRQEAERHSLSFDIQAYEVLMFAYYQCGLYEAAENVHLLALKDFGFAQCNRLLNLSLWAMSRKNDWLAAKSLLDRYSKADISANASSLSHLVALAARHDLVHDAEALMLKLKEQQAPLPPATITYNQILALHLRNDNYTAFLSLIEQMRGEGVNLDKFSRTMLFDVLGKMGDAQLAKGEFERSRSDDATNRPWSAMELSALFTCFFKVCQPELIAELIALIKDQQWLSQLGHTERLDVSIALIRAFGLIGDWHRSWSLAEEVISNESKSSSSSDPGKANRNEIVALRAFLSVLLETRTESSYFSKVLPTIQQYRIYRDPDLLALIMKAATSLEDFDTVHSLWAELSKRRKVTSLALESFCERLLLDSSHIYQIPQLISQHRSRWTAGLALVHLKFLLLTNELEALLPFFTSLPEMGVKVNVEHCNVVLSGGNADFMVTWMLNSAIFSNSDTVNILLNCNSNNLDLAVKLVDRYVQVGRKPPKEQILRVLDSLKKSPASSVHREKALQYANILQ